MERPHDLGSLTAIVSIPVMEGTQPVLQVWHADEGDWQLSCLTIDDSENADNWATVHVQHILDRDPSLAELMDLPPGWAAHRDNTDEAWTCYLDD
jgi:hypothetical protein